MNLITVTKGIAGWDATVSIPKHGVNESIEGLYDQESATEWANSRLVYHDNKYVRCC